MMGKLGKGKHEVVRTRTTSVEPEWAKSHRDRPEGVIPEAGT